MLIYQKLLSWLVAGGFSHQYWCVCDYLGLPYREEVQWVGAVDRNHLFVFWFFCLFLRLLLLSLINFCLFSFHLILVLLFGRLLAPCVIYFLHFNLHLPQFWLLFSFVSDFVTAGLYLIFFSSFLHRLCFHRLCLCFSAPVEFSFVLYLNTPSLNLFPVVFFTSSRMWTPSIWPRTPESSTCRTSSTWRTGTCSTLESSHVVCVSLRQTSRFWCWDEGELMRANSTFL